MLQETNQPLLTDRIEKTSEVRVENIVHFRAVDTEHQSIQRIMLAALRSEPIREPEEIFLVDRVQHHAGRPLDDLVFQGRDRERALLPIGLRYIPPPRWQCPICSSLDPCVQILNSTIEVCFVVPPDQPVYAGCRFSLQREERQPE